MGAAAGIPRLAEGARAEMYPNPTFPLLDSLGGGGGGGEAVKNHQRKTYKTRANICGVVTALLCCTKQQCKQERGENHLYCGLCSLSTCCAFGTVSDGNIYSSFSFSTNSTVPRKSTLSSHRAQVRQQHPK